MLLLDITGSMNFGVGPKDQTPRKDVVREAISIIVAELAKYDSQAKHEADGGGLRTVTFSGGNAADIGDLNSANLKQKWGGIKFAGGTKIIPGLKKLFEVYMEEFGSRSLSDRPTLMALVITDGDADDHDQFVRELKSLAGSKIYMTMAVIGYGPDYNNALATYNKISAANQNVKALAFGSETNPEIIAAALLRMVNLG